MYAAVTLQQVTLSVQQLQQYIAACHSSSTGVSPSPTVDSTVKSTVICTLYYTLVAESNDCLLASVGLL
jgi:hypothetical protein